MKLTAEMSLYPLQEGYIPAIQRFIDLLQQQGDLQVISNAMSTQICGEYQRVFAAVSDALAATTLAFGKQVLVVKFIPWELELQV